MMKELGASELESDSRNKIIDAATQLIAEGGPDAATTRAVADAAGVQAPTIYRLFGDKERLLSAVAEQGFAAYVAKKARKKPHPDPVQDLRDGWDMHVAFALANPGLFSIMNAAPAVARESSSFAAGLEILKARVHRIAVAGRLRVSEERAVALVQSVGVGTIMTLLSQPEHARDLRASDVALDMVVSTITTDTPVPHVSGPREAASTLRANLGEADVLTAGERHLLRELLDRIANGE